MKTYISKYPKLKYRFIKDGDKYYSMKSPMEYFFNNEKYILMDDEFLFNLASVPKALRKFYKPDKKDIKYASIPHDHDYSNRTTNRLRDDLKLLGLQRAEQLKYINMLKFRKDRIMKRISYFFQRWIIFILLRLFGWINKA